MSYAAGVFVALVMVIATRAVARYPWEPLVPVVLFAFLSGLMALAITICNEAGHNPLVGITVVLCVWLPFGLSEMRKVPAEAEPADPGEDPAVPSSEVERKIMGLPFEAVASMRTFRHQLFAEYTAAVGGGDFHLHIATHDWVGARHPDARLSAIDRPGWPYVVMTNQVATALDFLADCTWQEIAGADQLHAGDFMLEVRPGTLVIRAQGASRERQRFNRFIERCGVIARRLHAVITAPALKVEIAGAGGKCPVCGVELGEGCVRCRRCATPHHADCWRYNGMCAVYACNAQETAGQPGPPPLSRDVMVRIGGRTVDGFFGSESTRDEPFPALIRVGTLSWAARVSAYADFRCVAASPPGLVEMSYRDSRRILGLEGGLRPVTIDGLGAWEIRAEDAGVAARCLDETAAAAIRSIADATLGAVTISMGRGRLYARATGPELDAPRFINACFRLGRAVRT